MRTEYQSEYRFADAPCEGCAEGERAVRYETDKHDAAHTGGTIVVDATGHVVRTISHPYVFPKYVNDGGEFTTRYGSVLDGKRLPVETKGAYYGHRGPMKGTDAFEQRSATSASRASRRLSPPRSCRVKSGRERRQVEPFRPMVRLTER